MSGLQLRSIALAVAVAGTAFVQGRVPVHPAGSDADLFVIRPEMARHLALGFDAVLADYYWLQAVQIVGAEPTRAREHGEILGRLIDVVTTLNPWVGHPYRFAAVWLTADEERVREGNRLLQRGIAHHPDDWRNYFYLGFNRFFYLGDYAGAADALEGAVGLHGGPARYGGPPIPEPPVYLKRLAARLRANSGDLDTAGAFLVELARRAEDPQVRGQYEEALAELETERRARQLDRARERYRERHGRDIAAVDDLVRGPDPILPRLPREPTGAAWTLDPATGRIVSTRFGRRYDVNRSARSSGEWGDRTTPEVAR